jgi:hypothetical protein
MKNLAVVLAEQTTRAIQAASRAAARSPHRPPSRGAAPISLSDREPPLTVASRGMGRALTGQCGPHQLAKWRYSRTRDLRGLWATASSLTKAAFASAMIIPSAVNHAHRLRAKESHCGTAVILVILLPTRETALAPLR